MHRFIPDKHKRVRDKKQPTTNYKPPKQHQYKIYSITIHKLRKTDKIRTYWITFMNPIDPRHIQQLLTKAYNQDIEVYSGIIVKQEMHTCIVELEQSLEWGTVLSITNRVLDREFAE